MKNIESDKELIAACGLYCGACRKYLAEKCPGCRLNEKAAWCKIRSCFFCLKTIRRNASRCTISSTSRASVRCFLPKANNCLSIEMRLTGCVWKTHNGQQPD